MFSTPNNIFAVLTPRYHWLSLLALQRRASPTALIYSITVISSAFLAVPLYYEISSELTSACTSTFKAFKSIRTVVSSTLYVFSKRIKGFATSGLIVVNHRTTLCDSFDFWVTFVEGSRPILPRELDMPVHCAQSV
jgi:hypothetical protein